jgi:hypothetical protein
MIWSEKIEISNMRIKFLNQKDKPRSFVSKQHTFPFLTLIYHIVFPHHQQIKQKKANPDSKPETFPSWPRVPAD